MLLVLSFGAAVHIASTCWLLGGMSPSTVDLSAASEEEDKEDDVGI